MLKASTASVFFMMLLTMPLQAIDFDISKLGYRQWASKDCKAFTKYNSSFCKSKDCIAMISKNVRWCKSSDCKATFSGKTEMCGNNDCRAIVEKNYSKCETNDCRARREHARQGERPAYKPSLTSSQRSTYFWSYSGGIGFRTPRARNASGSLRPTSATRSGETRSKALLLP